MPTVAERAEKTWTPAEIRALRICMGWSVQQAADLVGVTDGMWYFWEQGRHKPRKPIRILFDQIEAGKIFPRS